MAATLYSYPLKAIIGDQLSAEIVAAGLPEPSIVTRAPAAIEIVMPNALSPEQVLTLTAVYDAHVPAVPRQPRLLLSIYQAVGALSGPQKAAIQVNLFETGSPPLFTTDKGPNASALLVLWNQVQMGGLSVSDKNLSRQAAASIYVLDNPTYLVNPAFDPTINVPGDEPIP